MKLNLNGRLLSSSPPIPIEAPDQKRTTGKRGRPRKTESRLAILKYGTGDDKRLAKLVDDIIHGHSTHKPAPVRPLIPAPPKVKKPAKPTHPFFLKKPTQESHPDCIPESTNTSETPAQRPFTNQTSRDTPVEKREPRAWTSIQSSFSSRTAKFPELVEALWPPRDLAHIRSVDSPQTHESIFRAFQNDQRKSKLRVVSVADDENALLVSTSRARKAAAPASKDDNDFRPTLRVPGRHIASGRVLQTAIDNQMSWATDPRSMKNLSLPVISNLRSSLLSSFLTLRESHAEATSQPR